MFNKAGAGLIEEKIGMLKLLDHLEKQCGGQGNGIALSNTKRVTLLKKGINYTNKNVIEDIKHRDYDFCLYHTRVTSSGSVNTKNCHPFLKGHTCLAMNGTESSFASVARKLDKTDTEMILDMFLALKIPIENLSSLSANYMGFENGKPFISNNTRNCLEVIQEGDAWAIASSFPSGIVSEELESGFWKLGDEIKIRKVVYPIYPSNNYYKTSTGTVYVKPDYSKVTKGTNISVLDDSAAKSAWDEIKKDKKFEEEKKNIVKKDSIFTKDLSVDLNLLNTMKGYQKDLALIELAERYPKYNFIIVNGVVCAEGYTKFENS